MTQEAIESNAIVTRTGVETLPPSLHETLMMTWQPGISTIQTSDQTYPMVCPMVDIMVCPMVLLD